MLNNIKQLFRPFYKIFRPIYVPLVERTKLFLNTKRCRKQAQSRITQGLPVQVMVGASTFQHDGWIATDLPYLDMTRHDHWRSIFAAFPIDRIVGEHVVEHLTEEQFRKFLQVIPPFLADNATIRIAIPDGYHPDPEYIEYVRPQGRGPGADDHKVLYTYDKMAEILAGEGFEYRFLEYFDAQGTFHKTPWSADKGYIGRCQANDPRNTPEKPTAYTSLIVDFWKA